MNRANRTVLAVAREPLLHFLLLGTLLFLAQPAISFWLPQSPEDRQIVVDAATRDRLAENWRNTVGYQPDDRQRSALLRQYIDREILLREALRRDLHRHDPVVRERLIRNLRFIEPDSTLPDSILFRTALAMGMHRLDHVTRQRLIQRIQHLVEGRVRISEAELRSWYREHLDDYLAPPRLSIRQLYFNRDRHAGLTCRKAESALAQLENGTDPDAIDADPFLHGNSFSNRKAAALERLFGIDLAAALSGQPPGQWRGPFETVYGCHLFRVDDRSATAPLPLDAVRNRVVSDLYRERERQALRQWLDEQRNRYEIVYEASP